MDLFVNSVVVDEIVVGQDKIQQRIMSVVSRFGRKYGEIWCADLVEMQQFSKWNKGYKF